MNTASIKQELSARGALPKKRFGQNFLTDQNTVAKMVETAGLDYRDTVLEIGPGFGILTKEVAKIAKKTIAVELDRRMVKILEESFDLKNVEIVACDILKFDETGLPPGYKIVANLPFYLSAPVIRKFLESKNPPRDLTLIVQKEVAQRIASKPGKMSILAVSVQLYAQPKIIRYVSKNSFWPVPGVDCAILKLDLKKIRPAPGFSNLFFEIVKAGFSQPRKQLINNFSKKLRPKFSGRGELETWLKKLHIDPTRRAETLSLEEWISLAKDYSLKNQKQL